MAALEGKTQTAQTQKSSDRNTRALRAIVIPLHKARKQETEKANGVIRLPVDKGFPSVNLAQAVSMVLTQVRLSVGGYEEAGDSAKESVGEVGLMKGETERFVSEFTTLAEGVGFSMPSIEMKIRSVFERAEMERSEYNLLLGLLRILKRRIFGGENCY